MQLRQSGSGLADDAATEARTAPRLASALVGLRLEARMPVGHVEAGADRCRRSSDRFAHRAQILRKMRKPSAQRAIGRRGDERAA